MREGASIARKGDRKGPHLPSSSSPARTKTTASLPASGGELVIFVRAGVGRTRGGDPCGRPASLRSFVLDGCMLERGLRSPFLATVPIINKEPHNHDRRDGTGTGAHERRL